MAVQYNLIGRRGRHDVIDAVPLLAEKLRVNVSCFNCRAYIIFFVNVFIEMNVNIYNEPNFSDVYQSVNYIGLLASARSPM